MKCYSRRNKISNLYNLNPRNSKYNANSEIENIFEYNKWSIAVIIAF